MSQVDGGYARLRVPVGTWVLAVLYVAASLWVLRNLLVQLMQPKSDCPHDIYFECDSDLILNPWDSAWGAVWTLLYSVLLASSIGILFGNRTARACLTAVVAFLVLDEIFWFLRWNFELCSSWQQCSVHVTSVWGYLPHVAAIGWLSFNVWYLFGPKTQTFFGKTGPA